MPAYRNLTFGVQTQSVTSGAPTSATVTMSPSPDNGDLVVVVLAIRNTGGAVPAITAPAGWTLVGAVGGGAANTAHVAVYRHRWLTGDSTAPQWTFAAVTGFCTTAVAFAGVDATTPEDAAAATYDSGGVAGTTLTATATSATAWAPYLACWAVFGQNPIPGSDGVRLVHAYGSADVLSVAEGRRPVAAAYTSTATSISAASRVGVLLTLRPADAGAASPGRDFYVRPDGADGGTGLTAGAGDAWATLGRAVGLDAGTASVNTGSSLLPGDRLYVAPGTYRETVAAGFATASSVAPVQLLGDPAAERFADLPGGDVVWSAFTTDDATAGATAPPLDLSGRSGVVLDRLALYGSLATVAGNVLTGDGSTAVTVRRCLLYGGRGNTNPVSVAPPEGACGWAFDRCVVVSGAVGSGILVTLPRSAAAEYDCGLLVEHCLFVGGAGASASNGAGVEVVASGALTYRGGGGVVRHCTFLLCANGVKVGAGVSAAFPVVAYRNAFYGGGASVMSPGTTALMQVVEDYNLSEGVTTAASNVLAGAASAVAANLDLALGHGPLFGRRPRPLGEPGPTSPLRRAAGVLLAPRPPSAAADQGGGNAAWTNPGNATLSDDVYAVSAAIGATTGVTNALRLTGFGFAVPAGAAVVGVRADVEAIASAASSVDIGRVQLVLSGAAIGSAKASTVKLGTAQTTFYALGGGTDLWGATPSRADANDPTFGVEVVFRNTNAATRTCSVDLVRLTVFYTHAASEPALDLYDRPRPGPYGVASAAGALERGDVATRDGLTYRTAAPSARIDGFGWQDWQLHVGAAATTISCYLRTSAGYAGDPPRLQLLADGEIGVAAQEAAMTVGAETWEQVAVAFTPTRAGLATVRVLAPSTAGGGAAGAVWVDDFVLT